MASSGSCRPIRLLATINTPAIVAIAFLLVRISPSNFHIAPSPSKVFDTLADFCGLSRLVVLSDISTAACGLQSVWLSAVDLRKAVPAFVHHPFAGSLSLEVPLVQRPDQMDAPVMIGICRRLQFCTLDLPAFDIIAVCFLPNSFSVASDVGRTEAHGDVLIHRQDNSRLQCWCQYPM